MTRDAWSKYFKAIKMMPGVNKKTGVATHEGVVVGRFVPTATGRPRFRPIESPAHFEYHAVQRFTMNLDIYKSMVSTRGTRGMLGVFKDIGFKVDSNEELANIHKDVDAKNNQIEFFQVVED